METPLLSAAETYAPVVGAAAASGRPGPADAAGSDSSDDASPSGPASGAGTGPTAPGAAPPGRGNGPSRALDSDDGNRRRRNLLIALVAAAVVIAVIIAAILLRGRLSGQGIGPGSTPTPSATPVLTDASLLTVDDVRILDEGVAWTDVLTQDRIDADTPRPNCIVLDAEGVPLSQSTRVRKIQAGEDPNSFVLHEAFQFATPEDAASATEVWTQQLGGCDQPISLIAYGWSISGVGDAATGVTTIVQDKTPVDHTVQLSRTGSVVHVIDAAEAAGTPDGTQVATLLGTAVGRTCEAAGGTCADSPSAAMAPPPATADNPEFLDNADLPRITPGTGRWGGTDVGTSFSFFGSQCESRDLATVSGPEARKHRAYLLQEDAGAPEGTFGVDEYILTFPDKGGADGLVKDLTDSINACEDNMLTATVDDGDAIELEANGQGITGRTWVVTQQVDENTQQRYRVAVVQVDRHVIYTLIPTGSSFDFSNDQWKEIAERAGERLATTL